MEVDIRPAADADAAVLVDLASEAFRATYGPVVDATTVEAVIDQACSETAFRRLIRQAARPGPERLLVAVEDGELRAFLDFGEEPDGLELRRLYTKVGGTSRGIGSSLLAHLEATLPAGTIYRIVVLAANERGLAFWKRHGFHAVSEIDGIEHFSAHRGVAFNEAARPEPLLVMERRIGHHDE